MQGASFKMVGDWRKTMQTTLDRALQVSVDVFGRTAGEACKHAVILMAQSTRALTPKSKERRRIMRDGSGEYVEQWRQGWSNPTKIHKWKFYDTKNFRGNAGFDSAAWENAQIIRNTGLSKRSWMWGLAAWGGKGDQREISGTSEVLFSQSKTVVEAVKRNKLSYITKIMPSGFESTAATKATNKIMKLAERKMQQQFVSTIRGGSLEQANVIKSFFLPEANAA